MLGIKAVVLFLCPMTVSLDTPSLANREHHVMLVRESMDTRIHVNGHSVRRRKAEDEPFSKPSITKLHVKSKIKSRFATTVVITEMENKLQTTKVEAAFYVQFPEKAFIFNFTMKVGGQFFFGVVKEKKEAQDIYDKARARNETAGIVKSHQSPTLEPGMDMFSITTTISANSSALFELTYQQLLEFKFYYTHYLYVDPMQAVSDFKMSVELNEPQGIKNLSATGIDGNPLPVVKNGSYMATIDYSPSSASQGSGIKGLVKVKYTVKYSCDAGVFKTCSSFFVHYFSTPKDDCSLVTLNRQICFVIDISGSMSGDKITKTRSAMNIILKLLKPVDQFCIVLFDDKIVEWKSELQSASPYNIKNALSYCSDNLVVDGGTNLYDGLERALQQLNPSVSTTDKLAPYVILLTDGQPNAGKFTTPIDILRGIKKLNVKQIPIYSIAFGAGADFNFLNALSHENGGYAIKIFDGSYDRQDMSQQLHFFYRRIASPVLKNVNIVYPEAAVSSNQVSDSEVSQYFDGSEVVIVGTLLPNAPRDFEVKVVGLSTSGQKEYTTSVTSASYGDCDLVERVYAYKWIKTLLLRSSMEEEETKKKILKNEALTMSLKYNFVTSLTSMVVVQENRMPMAETQQTGNSENDLSKTGYPGGNSWSQAVGIQGDCLLQISFSVVLLLYQTLYSK